MKASAIKREQAITWFTSQQDWVKNILSMTYTSRHYETLTGREIENIYKKENQKLEKSSNH